MHYPIRFLESMISNNTEEEIFLCFNVLKHVKSNNTSSLVIQTITASLLYFNLKSNSTHDNYYM